jgi:hypothetical protein
MGAGEAGALTGSKTPVIKIARMSGQAWLAGSGLHPALKLREGAILSAGDQVRTEVDCRLEIRVADACTIRFDEKAVFSIRTATPSGPDQSKRIDMMLQQGKAWINLALSCAGQNRFVLSTWAAATWARGTVYRVDVNPDKSIQIKVYQGEVVVEGVQPQAAEKKQAGQTGAPPDAKRAWTHIMGPMQQIAIHGGGVPTKPFRFSAKSDQNPWVRWNHQLDETGSP